MAEKLRTTEVEGASACPQFVNLIMHGAFGYVFGPENIRVYTPRCFGHQYMAGSSNTGCVTPIEQGVDYRLIGVKASANQTIPLDDQRHPVISLSKAGIDRAVIDRDGIRHSYFELPYPAPHIRNQLFYGALNAYVGAIYSGNPKLIPSLNGLIMCPSLHIIVYELEPGGESELVPIVGRGGTSSKSIVARERSTTDPNTVNFHVFCSKMPMSMQEMHDAGMTPEGHLRRAFAGVTSMFGGLELSLSFPNRFRPAVPEGKCIPPLPCGVDPCNDLEPGEPPSDDCDNKMHVRFGHVNCAFTDLLFVP